MQSEIQITDGVASFHVYSGWGNGPHVKLLGATFPIMPVGLVVNKFSATLPEGLHAAMFLCDVEIQEFGSGRNRTSERIPPTSNMLLGWTEEDGKLIVKADEKMSAAERARFNPFVRSDIHILVTDTERKIVYLCDLGGAHYMLDPTWTYKSVSMNSILEYITKKLTLTELDQRATEEQAARDELAELRKENFRLKGDRQADEDLLHLQQERINDLQDEIKVVGDLFTQSVPLYKFLERIPVIIRPKVCEGFIEAMKNIAF